MTIPTITVSGGDRTPAGTSLTNATGTLTFTLTTTIVDSVSNLRVHPVPIVVTLSGGTFTQILACTSGGDIAPSGVRYRVEEAITGAKQRYYYIALPSSLGATVNLADLVPIPGTPQATWGVPQFALDELTDVDAPTPDDGDALVWDEGAGEWVPAPVAGGGANLAYTASPTQGVVTSDSGTDATVPAADGSNAGLLLPAEKTKLAGVATGATANDSDANLKARANHTGTQPASTISDFATAADARIVAVVVKAFIDALGVDAATLGGQTVAQITTAITAAIVDTAPVTLDTLNELAAALGDDPNFATTVTTALAGKQPLDADLTAIAALATAAYGRGLLTLANSAALAAELSGTYEPLVVLTSTGDTTDRAAAIEAAATSAQGGRLHFREGDYYIASTLDVDLSNILITGDPGARIVTNAASVLGFEFGGTSGTHLENITVRGLTFYDPDPAGHVGVEESHAIVAKYVENLLVEDCVFEGMGDESIDCQHCENGTVRRNRFINYAAASSAGGAIGINNSDGMNIESNWFEGGTQGNAIRIEVTVALESTIGNRIVGNRILAHDGIAIAVSAGSGDLEDLLIAQNRILDCTSVPISVVPSATFYARDVRIVNNRVKGGGAEAPTSPSHRGAIYCGARTEGTIIQGNHIRSWGTDPGHHGIVAVDAIIEGNRITAVADCGIRTQDDVAGSTIADNHVYDSGTAASGTRKAIHAVTATKIRGNVASNNLDDTTIENGLVHDTGAETIAGVKTFSSDPLIPDEAYDATNWNGVLEPTTKNAVRDKIEAILALTVFARKTGNTVRNNTGALAADPDLVVAVEANAVYIIDGFVVYDGTTTGDMVADFTIPASATMTWNPLGPATTASSGIANENVLAGAHSTQRNYGAVGAGTKVTARPGGLLITGASAGSVTFRWAQLNPEVSDLTVYADSWLLARRVA